jgi:hypothetical protein
MRQMPSSQPLVARIRGEYSEMPGLRLTFAQACRLWQMDASTCEVVLDQLVLDNFLTRTRDGSYIALPSTPRAHAKAQLQAPMRFSRSA